MPLHIYEDRYKEMVDNAIRDHSEFGIVLAKDDGIDSAGCSVVVDRVLQMYPDGRMDIVARGQRRFEIQSLDEEREYLQAQVEFFDDEDFGAPADELRAEALQQQILLRALGVAPAYGEPDLEDPQLSFQVAQALPDAVFLSVLLRSRSETERLKELSQYLAEFIPRRRTIEHMKDVVPTNGHGTTPKGL